MSVLSGIYRIVVSRPDQQPKYYIGQSANIAEREAQHLRALRANRHDNSHLQRSFIKYGEDSFSFSTVLICGPEMLSAYEQAVLNYHIKMFCSDSVLNVMRECVDSHLGVKRRPETIERMSLSQKGRKKPPDQVARMAAAMKGKRPTEEARRKMSESKKGRLPYPNAPEVLAASETRLQRLREVLVGRPKVHSEETRRKISQALTGRKPSPQAVAKQRASMIGRKHSAEHIAKRVASRHANRERTLANGDL